MAPLLHVSRPEPDEEGQGRPPPAHLRESGTQDAHRDRDHRIRPPHHAGMGRDRQPPRLEDVLQAAVRRRHHARHDEARLDPHLVAPLAARALLPATQRASDVRRIAAEPAEGAHAIAGSGGTPISPARQSRYGTSTVSPSFATIVSLKTSRASLTSSSALIE